MASYLSRQFPLITELYLFLIMIADLYRSIVFVFRNRRQVLFPFVYDHVRSSMFMFFFIWGNITLFIFKDLLFSIINNYY